MAWKKHFRFVRNSEPANYINREAETSSNGGGTGTSAKFSSYLPEVYAGHPNRIQRYYQYEDMDKDSDISVALNTIADFCTQSEEQSDEPFFIKYNEADASDTEIKLLQECLTKWVKINKFRQKLYVIFRSALLNGDAFFLRDPETFEWTWLDAFSVLLVKVDEEKGKIPTEYVVKGLDYSRNAKFATTKTDTSVSAMGTSSAYASRASGTSSGGTFQLAGAHVDSRSTKPGQNGAVQELSVIDAKHIVHLSLSIGMDVNWPFGKSVLEPIYKVYKQKEMLEDSIIIYRVQRAPERRIFYIDVGDMAPPRAMAHVQKIKNEIHQRRIPNRSGGGQGSMVDGAYNPLAVMDDYYFAQTAGGRGSKVETLPGGDNLGEIGDLDWFTRKFARGLQIPSSYLAISDEKSGGMYNDGKNGNAMIQEFRFNKFCLRLQALVEPIFDAEFKHFVDAHGVNVTEDWYELRFNPPQNFSKYRQMDLDAQQMGVYGQVAGNKVMSERMKLIKYGGWSEDDIRQNEEWYAQENPEKMKKKTGGAEDAGGSEDGLSAVGLRSGGMDFGPMDGGDPLDDASMGDDAGAPGAAADGGAAGGGDPLGGAAPPAAPPA